MSFWRMMYPKSESDAASVVASSSSRPTSPKRPVYYVQSPSRDSRDHDDKSTSSIHATPAYDHSPLESPSHASTYGRHSRASSASRVSGNWRRSSRGRRRSEKGWHQFDAVDEDGELDDVDAYQVFSRRSKYCLMGVGGFGLFFAMLCLILWCASRPFKPQISIKSMNVQSFYIGEGSDRTGVPTRMSTLNCSVTLAIHNPAGFFGVYVSSNPVNLFYSEIRVATGELETLFLPRKSERDVPIIIEGQRIPLYGAGADFIEADINGGVPLKLNFKVDSLGYLVGKLVKTRHQRHFSCSLAINSKSTKEIKFKHDFCDN